MLGSSEAVAHKATRRARKGKLARCWLVGSAICLANILGFEKAHSVSIDRPNHYRQWAFIQLNNLDEFYCLDTLYFHESRWNPKAKNGSHHGIPQGRSKYLATVDGFKQIEWGIKYINNRYGSMCNALDHWKRKGWH
jgi:hypothetical protein